MIFIRRSTLNYSNRVYINDKILQQNSQVGGHIIEVF